MTEVEKLDAEIVRTGEALVAWWESFGARKGGSSALTAFEKAVAAKRAAMKPTLLDCEDASRIYKDHCSNSSAESMDAVLTACLERAYKVIEALPVECVTSPLHPTPGAVNETKRLVDLAKVKSALLDGRSA